MKGNSIANARLSHNCRASHALKEALKGSRRKFGISRISREKPNTEKVQYNIIGGDEKWPANRLQTVRHCPQKNQPSLSSTVAPPLLGNRHSDSCGPPTKENSGFLRPRKWAKMSWASACMHRKSIWCILSLFEPLASRISVRDREALLRRSMCTCARGAHLPTAQRDVLPTPSQHDLFRAVGSLA